MMIKRRASDRAAATKFAVAPNDIHARRAQ
jgi:hypothetical protein